MALKWQTFRLAPLVPDTTNDNHAFRPYAGLVKENLMLSYALVFFIIAIIAAVFGFSGLASGAAGIAKILFVVFLVMAIVSFAVNLLRGR